MLQFKLGQMLLYTLGLIEANRFFCATDGANPTSE